MEPIILLIISLIIGTLLKGKDNQKPPAKRPEHTPRQDVPPKPAAQGGNLKDLTKQLYGDLQKEIQKQAGEFRTDPREADSQPVRQKREADRRAERRRETVTRTSEEASWSSRTARPERERSRDREHHRSHPAEAVQPIRKREASEPEHLFPESDKELARAVVFAEILGPPKAKRR